MATEALATVRSAWAVRAALVLEIVIAVYSVALGAILLGGGFTLGWLSVTNAAKPILVLILAIPARLAIEWPSPLTAVIVSVDVKRWLTAALTRVPASVRDVAVAMLITRPAAFAAAFMVNILFPPRAYRGFTLPFDHAKWFEIFAAWDSGWYFEIAKNGYRYNPDGQSTIAFFPLYPMAMRAVAFLFGGSDRALWISGLLISWVAFICALIVLHRFTTRLFGDREAGRRAVLYLAVFPFSFFFSRVYTESLFLLVSIVAVVSAYDGRWWRAGAFAALAALTRPNGVLVVIPLFCLIWQGRPAWRELIRRGAAVSLAAVGFAAYCAFTYSLAGNPLAWLDAQRYWHYSVGDAPWRQLLKLIGGVVKHGPYDFFFTSKLAPYQFFHGAVALIFLGLTPAVFRHLGVPLGLYVLVSLLVPLSGSDLQGLGRYASVLFPVFMVAGVLSGRFHEAILVVCTLFLTLFVALFVLLHPIF